MSNAPRQVGEASMGGFHVHEATTSERAKMDLLDLGEAGFRVFRPRDLDWTHDTWLVTGAAAARSAVSFRSRSRA